MENKRAYVTPSSVVPLLSKIWDGPEGGLQTTIKPLKEVSCSHYIFPSLPHTLILVCLSIFLSFCQSLCLSVSLSVCLSVCLSLNELRLFWNFILSVSCFLSFLTLCPLLSSITHCMRLSLSLSLPLLLSSHQAREHCKAQILSMRSDHTRACNPTPYKISVSQKLYEYIHQLWMAEAPIADLS